MEFSHKPPRIFCNFFTVSQGKAKEKFRIVLLFMPPYILGPSLKCGHLEREGWLHCRETGLYQGLSNQKFTYNIFIAIGYDSTTKLDSVCLYREEKCSAEKCIGACSGKGCPKTGNFWHAYFTVGSFCETILLLKENRTSQFSLSSKLWVQSMLV